MAKEMTPRQRLLTTMAHKEPDRVPCAPWNSIQFPSKAKGIPLGDLDGAMGVQQYTKFWKPQLETDIKFGFDSVILGPLCIGGGEAVAMIVEAI